jgi:hypothetical protein
MLNVCIQSRHIAPQLRRSSGVAFPFGLSRKLISVPFFVKYLIFSAEYGMIVKAIPHKDRLTALCGIA